MLTNTRRQSLTALGLCCTLVLTGCSSGDDTAQSATEAQPATTQAAQATGLPRTAAPDDARVYFVSPADGDTVTSPVRIEFGAANVGIAPAGTDTPATGHHHLIVNAPLPPEGLPIPKNDQYRHFGGGQTETSVELAPGDYELTLLLGDHLHIPHDPVIHSDTITITVSE